MQLKKLLQEDDAVSPVIGVILMVAITVILAAVIASFVLGMGQQQEPTPTATIGFDYGETTDGFGALTISHDGGETVNAENLYVRGTGFADASDVDDYGEDDLDMASAFSSYTANDGESWTSAHSNAPNQYGSGSEITSGSRFIVAVESDYEIDVVWQSTEGDSSSTLNSHEGPDA